MPRDGGGETKPHRRWTFAPISGKEQQGRPLTAAAIPPPATMPESTMKTPLVLAAFGTVSAEAAAAYDLIDQAVRRRLAATPIHWAYTSRVVRARTADGAGPSRPAPIEVLAELAGQGYHRAIVQPLLLLPGHEFHQLQQQCRQAPLPCQVAPPLLTSPQDYHDLAEALAPSIEQRPDEAVLLVGHGTNHPIWVAYHAIETVFRRRFGRRIFVGVIEKSPDSTAVPGEIVAAGWRRVRLIPLLLVAGMHFDRDVIGSGHHAWRSRLEQAGLAVECVGRGLGRHPAAVESIAAAIAATVDRIDGGDASVCQGR